MTFEALVLIKFGYRRKVPDKRSYMQAGKTNDHFNRTFRSDNQCVITDSIFERPKRRCERYIAYIASYSTTWFNGNNIAFFQHSVFLFFIWLAKSPLIIFPKKQFFLNAGAFSSVEVRNKLLYNFYRNLSHQAANKLRIFIKILRNFCSIHASINQVVIIG